MGWLIALLSKCVSEEKVVARNGFLCFVTTMGYDEAGKRGASIVCTWDGNRQLPGDKQPVPEPIKDPVPNFCSANE